MVLQRKHTTKSELDEMKKKKKKKFDQFDDKPNSNYKDT